LDEESEAEEKEREAIERENEVKMEAWNMI